MLVHWNAREILNKTPRMPSRPGVVDEDSNFGHHRLGGYLSGMIRRLRKSCSALIIIANRSKEGRTLKEQGLFIGLRVGQNPPGGNDSVTVEAETLPIL